MLLCYKLYADTFLDEILCVWDYISGIKWRVTYSWHINFFDKHCSNVNLRSRLNIVIIKPDARSNRAINKANITWPQPLASGYFSSDLYASISNRFFRRHLSRHDRREKAVLPFFVAAVTSRFRADSKQSWNKNRARLAKWGFCQFSASVTLIDW